MEERGVPHGEGRGELGRVPLPLLLHRRLPRQLPHLPQVLGGRDPEGGPGEGVLVGEGPAAGVGRQGRVGRGQVEVEGPLLARIVLTVEPGAGEAQGVLGVGAPVVAWVRLSLEGGKSTEKRYSSADRRTDASGPRGTSMRGPSVKRTAEDVFLKAPTVR